MKHITIKDIAKELKISISTVSRALTNDKNIRKETKKRVLDTAEKLGYMRNPVAINLKTGRSNTVGVIVPEIDTPFYAQIIEGIQNVLYKKGLKVIIAYSGENPDREKENLLLMESFMVDGIIIGICHKDKNKNEFQRLINKGIPLVFYDRIPTDIDVTKVIADDYVKSFLLTEHLIRKGAKKIAHIMAPEYMQSSYVRWKGYKDSLEKFGIPYDSALVITCTGMHFKDGIKAAQSLISKKISFDAVYVYTDLIAIGVMKYLQNEGFNIPKDVAIAGFSGTLLSEMVSPPLTTVELPLLQMGKVAAELILEKIKNPEKENQTLILDAEIKLRASTEG
ncbi:LacI family DNA-binding transcriptional regulator [Apibacter sp. HY039]|uniref:LacI family DNA-binding transcriptional regulator n=1 Tax=Apibacter sp. HY039 TaxID=2501476 RepID=UPI000FEB652F|nr:LacI family DNA-binding transcriptional regulator [Apibacter sp. HY039]